MSKQSAVPNPYPPRTHLLIDDLHVERQEGVEPVLCNPVKEPGPVLKPEKPWEGSSVNLNSGFLYDEEEEVFKLWYAAHAPDAYPELGSPRRAAYAVSADCRDWERPRWYTRRQQFRGYFPGLQCCQPDVPLADRQGVSVVRVGQ